MPGRQRDDQIAMNDRPRSPRRDQAAIRGARECGDGALDLVGVAQPERAQVHPERRRHGLDSGELRDASGVARVLKDCHAGNAGGDVFEQFQPFRAHAEFGREKTGGVTTRPRQAIDEAGADRVEDRHEHDRHGTGRQLQLRNDRVARGKDEVWGERDELRRVSTNPVGIARDPSVVDPHIAAIGPSLCCSPCANAVARAIDSGSSTARFMSTPMRGIRSRCSARAASGQAAAAPPRNVMKSRRFGRSNCMRSPASLGRIAG